MHKLTKNTITATTTTDSKDFKRVIVLFNPASTRARYSLKCIAVLERLYPDELAVVHTSPDGREANLEIIRQTARSVKPATLFCIAAGDGTVSLVVEAFTASGKHAIPKSVRSTPILPLWGGNANDLAYMLNGLLLRRRLKSIIAKASLIPIYPLQCTVTYVSAIQKSKKQKGKQKTDSEAIRTTRTAACYVTFGVSGAMARRLNDAAYRSSLPISVSIKLVRELAYLVQEFRRAISFRYTDIVGSSENSNNVNDADELQEKTAYELIFANGSRMAKVDRLPVTLSERYFYKISLERKGFGSILKKYLTVSRDRQAEHKLEHPVTMKFHDQAWAQFDGEPLLILPGSTVTIATSAQPFYALASSLRQPRKAQRLGLRHHVSRYVRKHKIKVITAASILLVLALFHGYLSLTNPYAGITIVKQPYTTTVAQNGDISFEKQFDLQVYDSLFADTFGYYKSGFLIAQNTLFGGKHVPGESVEEITDAIHKLRFDPSKPYLISGDQFSVLYVRNLGVFYNSLLNPNNVRSQYDWENRQRIYFQSALYGLDALAGSSTTKTTVVPIGSESVAMTAVHPGSTGSDTVYGLLYALNALATPASSADGTYQIQTAKAAQQLVKSRHQDLKSVYDRYESEVRDRDGNGDFVKKNIVLASARDGADRQQSFYDSLVLWKTRQLAQQMGLSSESTESIEGSRQRILEAYWSEKTGCLRDELSKDGSYSSDWLLALPTGFFDYERDYGRLMSCVDHIRSQRLAEPLPIKYTYDVTHAPWAVRTFAPGYGSDVIWSYWGAEYITLLAKLDQLNPDPTMRAEALRHASRWDQAMLDNHGFPETLDPEGKFLHTPLYKSIRSTGWLVQFEYAKSILEKRGT